MRPVRSPDITFLQSKATSQAQAIVTRIIRIICIGICLTFDVRGSRSRRWRGPKAQFWAVPLDWIYRGRLNHRHASIHDLWNRSIPFQTEHMCLHRKETAADLCRRNFPTQDALWTYAWKCRHLPIRSDIGHDWKCRPLFSQKHPVHSFSQTDTLQDGLKKLPPLRRTRQWPS